MSLLYILNKSVFSVSGFLLKPTISCFARNISCYVQSAAGLFPPPAALLPAVNS